MKVSLRWLCDHIQGLAWSSVDISQLIARFNAKVAEIEQVEKVETSVSSFEACRVVEVKNEAVTVRLSTGMLISLPFRFDCTAADSLAAFLIEKDAEGYRWVTLHRVGLEKDGLVPALHMSDDLLSGGWRDQWEEVDYILDVDNKSLTHRPDMWGHRGFAREVGALFGKRLIAQDLFLSSMAIMESVHQTVSYTGLTLQNNEPSVCSGLAAVRIDEIVQRASDIKAVSRFVKIGYRPRNAVIDMTNYVMADWGHPMHAYDSERICGTGISLRYAQENEKFLALDGSDLTLDRADLVIVDSEKVVGLAGIMGGAHDSVSANTTRLVLEAGNFHASTVRRSAARHKLRTESSQRFEKTLDSRQLEYVLQRCVNLGLAWGVIPAAVHNPILVMRPYYEPLTLTVSHTYIIGRIGVDLALVVIKELLESIEFLVTYTQEESDVIYTIIVPSYRSTKDISGAHDIVEEVARLYGFDNITPELPAVMQRASSLQPVMRERLIKNYLAQAAGMQEQRNYAFYNEQVLAQIGWQEEEYLFLKNPVSQEARRLVGSLIPHLLGNVIDNIADVEQCAFFEWGTVWPGVEKIERKELAGVWYKKRGVFNFYELKDIVNRLCHLANVAIEWKPLQGDERVENSWLASPAALLFHDKKCVGSFGMVHPVIMQKMGGLPESTMYAFTVDATLLQNNEPARYTAGSMHRFQHSTIDLSVMVPQTTQVADLEKALQLSSTFVEQVRLIDFFEKKEWADSRSLAFRLIMSHPDRTLTKEEIDLARNMAIECLKLHGGQLRE